MDHDEWLTTTRYACVLLCLANSLPAQKHDGQMSTPSPGSQTGSAHFMRIEWVSSQLQLSHCICKPGSFTAV